MYLSVIPPLTFVLGGLLIDFGVLTLKPGLKALANSSGVPRLPPSHGAVVEWRAMTVIAL